MNEPPILEYASPAPASRWLKPAVYLLRILGGIYTLASLLMCVGILANDPHVSVSDYVFFLFVTLTTIAFIGAAIHVNRRSKRWALIAFVVVLVNLAALLSCVGTMLFEMARFGRLDPSGMVSFCTTTPLSVTLISLTLMLYAVMRDLKRRG